MFMGFYVKTECFSLIICFKITFETLIYILKLITITFVIKNYEVEFLFLCRDVICNLILGISDHIFLSVIFSWIRLVKRSKSGGHVAEITQICFSKVQHWFHYLHISIWCQNNVAHEEKRFFFHIRQTFGMRQNLADVSFSLLHALKVYLLISTKVLSNALNNSYAIRKQHI